MARRWVWVLGWGGGAAPVVDAGASGMNGAGHFGGDGVDGMIGDDLSGEDGVRDERSC